MHPPYWFFWPFWHSAGISASWSQLDSPCAGPKDQSALLELRHDPPADLKVDGAVWPRLRRHRHAFERDGRRREGNLIQAALLVPVPDLYPPGTEGRAAAGMNNDFLDETDEHLPTADRRAALKPDDLAPWEIGRMSVPPDFQAARFGGPAAIFRMRPLPARLPITILAACATGWAEAEAAARGSDSVPAALR